MSHAYFQFNVENLMEKNLSLDVRTLIFCEANEKKMRLSVLKSIRYTSREGLTYMQVRFISRTNFDLY